jgi:7,8-dihydropterin-6-yl-methyl-4-(beta-D-ribofuranosyl)aminobenzene 5'-phosphate synthase
MRIVWTMLCAAMLVAAADPPRDRLVLLYDSSAVAPLEGGWGYAAYIEYRGKRILFDTGQGGAALTRNTAALGIDLSKLDAVVISHDDPDHYAGLDAVYAANPRVPVFVPDMDSGAFSTSLLNHLYRMIQSAVPGQHVVDPPAGANYMRVRDRADVLPGVRVASLPFESGQRREQVLLLSVSGGVVLVSGCAHPGIVNLMKIAGAPVKLATGGFHLTNSSEPDIRKTAQAMKQAGVVSVYPAHCTGRFATAELHRVFGSGFGMVAVGGVVPLPK